MKFVLSRGGPQVREQLDFPDYYANVFSSPSVSLLVLCVANNGRIVGGCSLSGKFNMAVLYIAEGYRRKGLGTQLFLETIRLAQERGMSFLSGAVPPGHIAALRIDFKVGFRLIKHFKDFTLVMRPINFKGELAYAFLHAIFSILPNSFVAKTYDIAIWTIKRYTLDQNR